MRDYRDALGRYPTGVTVVTAFDDGRPVGITVNSFASVSLQPRLILWSLGRDSVRFEAFARTDAFAVNILAADQEAIAVACAVQGDLPEGGWIAGAHRAPLLTGALARLQCRTHARHEGGDHLIIVGEVLAYDMGPDAPALTYHRSGYGLSG